MNLKLAATTFLIYASIGANANTVLDFEDPLPAGLVATSYLGLPYAPDSARVTDQYIDQGIRIGNAALVNLGFGHSASGSNSLAGINPSGQVDFDQPVTFSFFVSNGSVGTTDYFAYSGDRGAGSGNIVTISAFDVGGTLLGYSTYVEDQQLLNISISGVGQFHSVTVDQTLFVTCCGGIGIDLVEFGSISPIAAVPEPQTYALMLTGLAGLGMMVRRRRPD